jgi:hypothetical protein
MLRLAQATLQNEADAIAALNAAWLPTTASCRPSPCC